MQTMSKTMEMVVNSSPVFIVEILSILFIVVVGIIMAVMVIVFIADKLQTKNAVTRNYPVIGHFRAVFIRGVP